MFEDPGKKIKTVAKVLFVVQVIAAVVLAFVFGIERGHYSNYFHAGLFFLILIGGIIFAYISNLILYGFGAIVENSWLTDNT